MKTLLTLLAVVLIGGATACVPVPGPVTPGPAPATPQLYSNHIGDMGDGPGAWAKPACETGADVIIWDGEPTDCDLDGSNTLVILGLPNEAACDDVGGAWVYEACENADH